MNIEKKEKLKGKIHDSKAVALSAHGSPTHCGIPMGMPSVDPVVPPSEVPQSCGIGPASKLQTQSSGSFYNSHLLAVVPYVGDPQSWD